MVIQNHKTDASLNALSGHQPRYEPSLEEIARLMDEIRKGWDADTYTRRDCTANCSPMIEHKLHIDSSLYPEDF